jgi:hypothetical protein
MKSFKEYIKESYTEESDSTFQNGKDVYQLNKIFKLSENIKPIKMQISDLSWILKYTDVDPKRVKSADISVPILVWKYKGQWVTVDGAHRLKKAVNEHKDIIYVKVLNNNLMQKALI